MKTLENMKKNTLIGNILTRERTRTVKDIDIENRLCLCVSKSCMYNKAKKYIHLKNMVNKKLYEYYKKEIHRKYKWYTYINTQRSEKKMINNFKKIFGDEKKAIVCIGDWEQKRQMKYKEPTKGKSIRDLFKRVGYKVYLVNEYKTSKMSFISGMEMETLKKESETLENRNH